MKVQGSLAADPETSSDGLFEAVQGHLDQAADRIGWTTAHGRSFRPIGARWPSRCGSPGMTARSTCIPGWRIQHNGAQRSLQGRPPFPPERVSRRVPLLLGADDVEDGTPRRAVRRRQGRREGRPEDPLRQRARAAVSFLLLGDRDDGRPVPRHPGPRRQHRSRARWRGCTTSTRGRAAIPRR